MAQMRWEHSGRGSLGPNFLLRIGDQYVGYFYPDASEGVDVRAVLEEMASAWNAKKENE